MPRSGMSDAWSAVAFYAGLSAIIPGSAVAGYFAGAFLDKHLGTGSTLAFGGLMLGSAAGITDVVWIVLKRSKRDSGS